MDLREVRYEAPLTQFLFHKATQGNIPLSGTFELTPLCNLSLIHISEPTRPY